MMNAFTYLVELLLGALSSILFRIAYISVYFSCLLAVTHQIGLLQKIIHRITEYQISKKVNKARVTLSSIDYDIVLGKITVRDLVIHTPEREAWKWSSPLIVRIGCLEVTLSLITFIDFLAHIVGSPCKEIYRVEISDSQVFVEKRAHIFNFHLLDPSLSLPDPSELRPENVVNSSSQCDDTRSTSESIRSSGTGTESGLDDICRKNSLVAKSVISDQSSETCSIKSFPQQSMEQQENFATRRRSKSVDEFNRARKYSIEGDRNQIDSLDANSAEKKANEIYTAVLDVVSNLGKAANEGGKEGLNKAFRDQTTGFVSQLKKFKRNFDSDGNSNSKQSIIDKDGVRVKKVAQESMKVMKHLKQTFTKEFKEQVETFKTAKRIPKKKGWVKKKETDKFRFGWILIRDARIFTKDILLKNMISTDNVKSENRIQGWGKPIHLKHVPINGSDLCSSTYPNIGNTLDNIIDILIKRMVTEVAKTNSGRLVQNTLAEVCAWMESKSAKSGVNP